MTEVSGHNEAAYDALDVGEYADAAPHLQHAFIIALYRELLDRAFQIASRAAKSGEVLALDLGAGDGTATRPMLQRGAHVVAVDVSQNQLSQLQAHCVGYGDRLAVRCEDVEVVLRERSRHHIVVANSFLHHVPDYLSLLENAAACVAECGILLTFQDPVWKPSMSRRDAWFSALAYNLWRLSRPDVIGGVWRRLRRMAGVWSEHSVHDMTEFHAIRDGVNQNRIQTLLEQHGFDCEVSLYCSCQGAWFQRLGERLGVRNTFAILAVKR